MRIRDSAGFGLEWVLERRSTGFALNAPTLRSRIGKGYVTPVLLVRETIGIAAAHFRSSQQKM
jgi:hypothetical protein